MATLLGRRFRALVFVLTWAVGLLWAFGVLRSVAWSEVALRWRQAPGVAWIAWGALNLGVLTLPVLRWWWISRAFSPRVTFTHMAVYRQAAFAVNYFTPGPQFGGEPLQVYWLHRGEGLSWSQALSSLSLEKAFEVGSNFTFLLLGAGVVWATRGHGALGFEGVGWLPVMLVVMGGMVGYGGSLWLGYRPLTRFGQHWKRFARWRAAMARWEEAMAQALRQSPWRVLAWVGLSLLTWAGLVWEYTWLWRLLGAPMGLGDALLALVLTRLALLSPLPGGIGALETAQFLAARTLGLPLEVAAGVVVVIRARDLVLGLMGWWAALPLAQHWASKSST